MATLRAIAQPGERDGQRLTAPPTPSAEPSAHRRLTRHALERLQERADLGDSTPDGLARRAMAYGLHIAETEGALREHLRWLSTWSEERHDTERPRLRVYRDLVWVWSAEGSLITVLTLPPAMVLAARRLLVGAAERRGVAL